MKIYELKAWEMKEKLEKGEISSREILESHLDRIEEVEENINAFISMDKEGALEEADRIDRMIANKEDLGLLAGIPLGVKDNIITKDFKTTAGSKSLENFQAPYDATVVERIKQHHGIIIGKCNLDEYAMGGSNRTSYFGPSKNPIDSKVIAGGSSGGSAAAVGAKEVPLSLGTDTGGSIRQPASYCGVVGVKPSYGYVSRYGLIPLSSSLDQIGVFGRDVRDANLILNAISGYDKLDTTSVDLDNIINLDQEKAIESLKGMKIGLAKEFFALDMDPIVKVETEKAIKVFQDAGAIIEEVSIPHVKYSSRIYMAITFGDASSNMARIDGIRYGYRAKDYESLDELYIKSRSESLGEEVKKRILLGTYILSGNRGEDYYKQAQRLRSLLIEDYNRVFSNYDLILTPTTPKLPHNLQISSSHYEDYTESVNLAGLCAISLPTSKGEGLRPGLQIIGDRFKDREIMKAALAYEGLVK